MYEGGRKGTTRLIDFSLGSTDGEGGEEGEYYKFVLERM